MKVMGQLGKFEYSYAFDNIKELLLIKVGIF